MAKGQYVLLSSTQVLGQFDFFPSPDTGLSRAAFRILWDVELNKIWTAAGTSRWTEVYGAAQVAGVYVMVDPQNGLVSVTTEKPTPPASTAGYLLLDGNALIIEESDGMFWNPIGLTDWRVGQFVEIAINPKNAGAAALDTEFWSSATGCRAFRIVPGSPAASISGMLALLAAYSTTESDRTALNALMAIRATGITTPSSGGTSVPGVITIVPNLPGECVSFRGWEEWTDAVPGARIKSIAVRSVGADYAPGGTLQMFV